MLAMSPYHNLYFPWTTQEVEQLKQAWGDGRAETVRRLEPILGRNYNAIRAKAYEIGLVKVRTRREWSEEEEQLIQSLVAQGASVWRVHQSLKQLCRARGFLIPSRIRVARRINEILLYQPYEQYTTTQLADGFGVRPEHIRRWFVSQTYARVLKPQRVKGGHWSVSRGNLRRFIRAFPAEVALTKVDVIWLIGVLS